MKRMVFLIVLFLTCSANAYEYADVDPNHSGLSLGDPNDPNHQWRAAISKLWNLTSNGFVKTSSGDGTLGVDTNTPLLVESDPCALIMPFGGDVNGTYNNIIVGKTIGATVSNTTPSAFTTWASQTGGARKVLMKDDANNAVWAYIKSYDVFTPAQILTFSVSTGTLMVMAAGQTYTDTPSFTLTYQGTASACSIDISGGEVNPTDYPYSLSSPYTSGTGPVVYAKTSIGTWTYTASATVDSQACTKTAYVYYYNEYRYGQTTTSSGYTDTDVDGFASSALSNTTFTGTGSAKLSLAVNITSGNYFVFAMPSRLLGTGIAFKDHATGFAIDMSAASPYTVSNRTSARAFSETFYVYRSTNTGLGSITIDIY